MSKTDDFKVQTEQFADIAVLRYRIPDFNKLTLNQKLLAYYLYEAALSGRDIIYDQNYKYNLKIRRTLEAIVKGFSGDRQTNDFKNLLVYTKRVWFSNGIHHHYSTIKFLPDFSKDYFRSLIEQTNASILPLGEGESKEDLVKLLTPVMFDPKVAVMRVNQASNLDLVKESANNFYEGVSQKEVEDYYSKRFDKKDSTPISLGLNSKLVKEGKIIKEKVWRIGGMYSAAIEKMVSWLEKAITVAENKQQELILRKLIEFYKTGNLETFDEYSIDWVKDSESTIDFIHGFIETYGDPLSYKGTYEAIISFKDFEATKRIDAISKAAQWFEDNSPIEDSHKKKNVKGISARVITVVAEAGDASPSTPIGVNLPNATWIREKHGSKSVNLGNIVHAYNEAASEEMLLEFAYSNEEIELHKKYANLADDLHTDMHEVIGHASGQINPGIGTPRETLKNYASTIEETRADLVALYYILDKKLVDIGVMSSLDAGKAEYNSYIRNGLMTQLYRIKPGENIEESHMRNRQLIAKWVYEHGKDENVIERKLRDGKTYFVINDYQKLRTLFGKLLREVQHITSEGDFKSAKSLVETYGVNVDQELHKEVLNRFERLNISPYKGFINPVLTPMVQHNKIIDIKVEYPTDFMKQMLEYAEKYSYLPDIN